MNLSCLTFVCSLFGSIQNISVQVLILDENGQKKYYYEVREIFNKERFNIDYNKYCERWIQRAGQIIFLNRTCFNGLWRFNSKGEFNSPRGRYKNPRIVDEKNLLKIAKLFQIATIKNADFTEIKKDLNGKNSFIYYDPPYKPISKTAKFTSYNKDNFKDDEQLKLAHLYFELNQKGYKQMLSNSDSKDNFFDEIYKDFAITRVYAKRSINSNPKKRSFIKEIVVTNY